jgi:hypothetical protein
MASASSLLLYDLPPSYEETMSIPPPNYRTAMGIELNHARENIILETKKWTESSIGREPLFPGMILGQWKCGTYSMVLNADTNNGFNIKRCHLGNIVFNPSELEWRAGKFYWKMKKSGNHGVDSHYCYNPFIPDTIIENNPGSENIFTREPGFANIQTRNLDSDKTPDYKRDHSVIGTWTRSERGIDYLVDIQLRDGKFIVTRPGFDTTKYTIRQQHGQDWSFTIHFDHFHYQCSSLLAPNTMIEKDNGRETIFQRIL